MIGWNGAWHPLAERFPMLPEDDLREMAESIREHGQFVACRMAPDGTGLDGRNRVAACALVEVEPQWEVYDGAPITFIIEVNGDRRHLTTGQRAMATAIGLVEAGQRQNGRFKRGSVPGDKPGPGFTRTWGNTVAQAGLVLDYAPELADQVLGGELALDAAHKDADDRRKRAERMADLGDAELQALLDNGVIDIDEAERRVNSAGRVAALPSDLAVRVNDGALSLDEAEAIRAESLRRIAAWAEEIERAYGVLSRMAGFPVPQELIAQLQGETAAVLPQLLAAITTQED